MLEIINRADNVKNLRGATKAIRICLLLSHVIQNGLILLRFVSKMGLRPEDRSDIICRVFKMKLDQLVKGLKDLHIFGQVRELAFTYPDIDYIYIP